MVKAIGGMLREPLVQFLLLGIVVFAVDHYVFENSENPRRIEIDDARLAELVEGFREDTGRLPSDAELETLLVKWTQNEVMYREALSMGLDKGDAMIRSRMVLKLRDVLFNNVIVEPPPDAALQAWFEENRVNYDRPDIIDFEQFEVDLQERESVQQLALVANQQGVPEALEGAVRRYELRIDQNLYGVFDDGDARNLIAQPLNTWTAVRSDRGWHVARITSRMAGEKAEFSKVRAAVVTDWQQQSRERELASALSEIVADYDISYEFSRDALERNLERAPSATQVSAR